MAKCRNERKERGPTRLLIVYAKTPAPGQVKTRIGKVVGADQAALIYEEMLVKVMAISGSSDSWKLSVAIPRESDPLYFERQGFKIMTQYGVDLGQRMGNSLLEGFRSGAEQVVIIGSDIPTLTRTEISDAFSLLDSVPAVIGPSGDGGFYLFGITENYREIASGILRSNISWSTPQVLDEFRELSAKWQLPLFYLPVKKDIDTYEDWLDYKSVGTGKET